MCWLVHDFGPCSETNKLLLHCSAFPFAGFVGFCDTLCAPMYHHKLLTALPFKCTIFRKNYELMCACVYQQRIQIKYVINMFLCILRHRSKIC
jgi:hypothetical protein